MNGLGAVTLDKASGCDDVLHMQMVVEMVVVVMVMVMANKVKNEIGKEEAMVVNEEVANSIR